MSCHRPAAPARETALVSNALSTNGNAASSGGRSCSFRTVRIMGRTLPARSRTLAVTAFWLTVRRYRYSSMIVRPDGGSHADTGEHAREGREEGPPCAASLEYSSRVSGIHNVVTSAIRCGGRIVWPPKGGRYSLRMVTAREDAAWRLSDGIPARQPARTARHSDPHSIQCGPNALRTLFSYYP